MPCGGQLVVPHGWGNPAGCVDTPASRPPALYSRWRESRACVDRPYPSDPLAPSRVAVLRFK